jgi:phosphoribosylformylglycinamidine (FGAM) synthase PurS component
MAMEALITYTLLFLKGEFNGFGFKIIIDTGASMSIMSNTMSKILKVDHMLDNRFKGKVVGVGDSNILGCLIGGDIKLGDDEDCIHVPVNIRVIDDGFDKYMVILGLDFLTSHKCIIDFVNRSISINGQSMKFLNEMEVQNLKEPYDVVKSKTIESYNNFVQSLENKEKTLDLLKKIITNIIKNPTIEKYQIVNISSGTIQKLELDGDKFISYLTYLGFINCDEFRLKFNGPIDKLILVAEM